METTLDDVAVRPEVRAVYAEMVAADVKPTIRGIAARLEALGQVQGRWERLGKELSELKREQPPPGATSEDLTEEDVPATAKWPGNEDVPEDSPPARFGALHAEWAALADELQQLQRVREASEDATEIGRLRDQQEAITHRMQRLERDGIVLGQLAASWLRARAFDRKETAGDALMSRKHEAWAQWEQAVQALQQAHQLLDELHADQQDLFGDALSELPYHAMALWLVLAKLPVLGRALGVQPMGRLESPATQDPGTRARVRGLMPDVEAEDGYRATMHDRVKLPLPPELAHMSVKYNGVMPDQLPPELRERLLAAERPVLLGRQTTDPAAFAPLDLTFNGNGNGKEPL